MKRHHLVAAAILGSVGAAAGAQVPAPGPDMILIRPTAKTADEVVEAIKAYSEAKKWVYMGANKAKQGEVTMVKVCLPQVGQILWPLGLHLSAMLPCGNFGVYQLSGQTQVSMLHPRYMQVLYPHPEVERAAAVSTPSLIDMLEAVAK